MIYKITLRDEVTYYIEANSDKEAIDQAHEFWAERDPSTDECEEVGKKLTSRFWDRKGRLMDINDLAETVKNAYYAELATDEEAVFIDGYAYENVGYCIFEDTGDAKAGRYYYDSYRDAWINIEELNQPYREMLAVFEGE